MAAFGATATRVVTASCPLCSNSDGWLDHHYAGAKPTRVPTHESWVCEDGICETHPR